MEPRRVADNVVVVARSFNPTILSQVWFVRHGIIEENEFAQTCVFSPFVVDARTKAFQLLVTPDRLQLTFRPDADRAATIRAVLQRIVQLLPHTPYVAVGFNVQYEIVPEATTYAAKLRKAMLVPEGPLAEHFREPDARFGSHLAKQVGEMRMTMEVKPARRNEQAGAPEVVSLAFNFHRDLNSDDKATVLVAALGSWDQAMLEAQTIAHAFGAKWEAL